MSLFKELTLLSLFVLISAVVCLNNLEGNRHQRQVDMHKKCYKCPFPEQTCRRGCEIHCEINLNTEKRNEYCDLDLICRCPRNMCLDEDSCSWRKPQHCYYQHGKKECVDWDHLVNLRQIGHNQTNNNYDDMDEDY